MPLEICTGSQPPELDSRPFLLELQQKSPQVLHSISARMPLAAHTRSYMCTARRLFTAGPAAGPLLLHAPPPLLPLLPPKGFALLILPAAGGPVYVSDRPGVHDFVVLGRLVLPDGSVLRCARHARPTADCLLRDVLRDGETALKVGGGRGRGYS